MDGASRPTMTTASSGRVPVLLLEVDDVGGDRRPHVGGDRAALEEARPDVGEEGHAPGSRRGAAPAPGPGAAVRRGPVRLGVAKLAALDVGARRLGQLLDLGQEPLDRPPRSSSAAASSPSEGRLTMTFSAAPWADASASRDATARSLAALRLLRPASASDATTTSRHAFTVRSGTSAATRAEARIAAVRAAFSSSVSRGSLSAVGERRVGGRVLVGERQEATGELPSRRPVARVARGVRRRTSGGRPRATRPLPPAPPRTRRPRPRRRHLPGWGSPSRGAR